jgi:hypothetical protein
MQEKTADTCFTGPGKGVKIRLQEEQLIDSKQTRNVEECTCTDAQ